MGVITSPGGTPVDLAVDIIRRHCGELRAQKVLKYLLTEEEKDKKPINQRCSLDKEEMSYDDELVKNTIAYMKHHLHTPVPLQEITEFMQVNTRQLNQAFIRSTGDTAAVHWRKLRLEHARKLMTNSSNSIQAIAKACGFADASHLIGWFRKQYGETPTRFRKRRREVERLLRTE